MEGRKLATVRQELDQVDAAMRDLRERHNALIREEQRLTRHVHPGDIVSSSCREGLWMVSQDIWYHSAGWYDGKLWKMRKDGRRGKKLVSIQWNEKFTVVRKATVHADRGD